MNRFRALLCGCVLAGGFATSARADEPPSGAELGDLLRQADLVLEGQVTNIDYKTSTPAEPGDSALPHTFVTYQILSIHKPRGPLPPSSGDTITLRFLGGLRASDGKILSIDRYPQFDLNDHDFLLIKQNARRSCPLTSCSDGRFRVIGGLVYDEFGQEIDLTPDGRMVHGPRHALPEVDDNTVGQPRLGGHQFHREVVDPGNEDGPPRPLPAGGRQMTDVDFAAFLDAQIDDHVGRGELNRVPQLVSADINQDFVVPIWKEAKPKNPHNEARKAPESASDKAERERYEANGEDPRQ